MRPLPSSKGWIVTNHKWEIADLMIGFISFGSFIQLINAFISLASKLESGALKWILSFPIAPETTCIGSSSEFSLQLPTTIFCIPLRLDGNNAECQPNNLSADNGSLNFCVASSIP